jgi:hypothetical protein
MADKIESIIEASLDTNKAERELQKFARDT